MVFVGIDPGKSGGIAWTMDCGVDPVAYKMPETERGILDLLEEIKNRAPFGVHAAIEYVHSSPQMGVKSAFTFGRGQGGLYMALTAVRIPFETVAPRRWQAEIGCLSGGDKRVTKARAQALFPALTITHATADALLIAEYCRRVHTKGSRT